MSIIYHHAIMRKPHDIARIWRVFRIEPAGPLRRWSERARQRHNLGQLDAHLLKDIGLTEDQRGEELRKPCWKA